MHNHFSRTLPYISDIDQNFVENPCEKRTLGDEGNHTMARDSLINPCCSARFECHNMFVVWVANMPAETVREDELRQYAFGGRIPALYWRGRWLMFRHPNLGSTCTARMSVCRGHGSSRVERKPKKKRGKGSGWILNVPCFRYSGDSSRTPTSAALRWAEQCAVCSYQLTFKDVHIHIGCLASRTISA